MLYRTAYNKKQEAITFNIFFLAKASQSKSDQINGVKGWSVYVLFVC